MNGVFGWLVTLVFLAMLAPLVICFFGQLFIAVAAFLLPWVIGLIVLMGLAIGIGAGLARRLRMPSQPHDRFPRGEVPRIRRPRGVRTER